MSIKRCAATTATGEPCRAWAVPGSEASLGEPRCAAHGGRFAAREATAASDESRALTVVSEPPAFFRQRLTPAEQVGLRHFCEETPLSEEIVVARALLGRLLDYLNQAAPHAILQLTPLLMHNLLTIAALLEKQQALLREQEPSQEEKDGAILEAMGLALDELGELWGIEL